MQFALVNGERTAPSPKLSGTCPACGSLVVAKCGTLRVHHWAHTIERNCDPWWERETQWHRDWKNLFAKAFQEVVLFDEQTGEKHVADVRTDHGLVIEFQHSHLRPEERTSRERYYKNMVWVVDGARLKTDLPRFLEGRRSFRQVSQGIFATAVPKIVFPRSWLECAAPVFFDFLDGPDADTRNGPLFCLLPGRTMESDAVVVAMQRDDFVRLASQNAQPLPARQLLMQVGEALFLRARSQARAYQLDAALSMLRYQSRSRRPMRKARF